MSIYSAFTKVEDFHGPNDGRAIFNGEIEYLYDIVGLGVLDGLIVTGTTSLQTMSATTIISGATNLYDIFLTTADGNDITRVQPGSNIYTGGTGNFPTVNISAATLTYLSATTVSANTFYSGNTNLYDIFSAGASQFQSQTLINTNGILTIAIPANHEIKNIIIKETSGGTAGDISIGTSAMAYDIIHDETVGANTVVYATLGFTFFSLVSTQDIYISSSAWGSGVVTIYLKTERAT